MNIDDFLKSIGFGKTKDVSLDDILKESYSLAFPYKIQEEVAIQILCPNCQGKVDYYADALKGGPEGSEMAIEWKCPECGEIIKGSDYGDMDEEEEKERLTPFTHSGSLFGHHPPVKHYCSAENDQGERMCLNYGTERVIDGKKVYRCDKHCEAPSIKEGDIEPYQKAHVPEVLPKHYEKNKQALTQVLGMFGISSEAAREIIRDSESPEAKEKIRSAIFRVLTMKYNLPDAEAQDFINKYQDADVDEMIQGIMSILNRNALPGVGAGAPRLGYLREAMERLYDEGLARAKELYVKTGKISGRILKALVEKDPTPQKKYIEWMARTFPKMPSMAKYDIIGKFDELCERNKIEQKDINRYENIEQVDDIVRKVEADLSTSEIKKGVKGVEDIDPKDIIFQNDKCVVVLPKKVDSSCKYGRGSTWCTASMGSRNYFNSYYFGRGVNLYYIIPLIDMGDKKYQKIAVAVYPNRQGSEGEKEVYDYNDNRIDNELDSIKAKLGIG